MRPGNRRPCASRRRIARSLFIKRMKHGRSTRGSKRMASSLTSFILLDAAHMMLTVNRLQTGGVHHFAMVHDSFGVHASDIDFLNRALREEFVRIYSEPVLQNFLKEQREAHPEVDLPELPQTGNLDIRQVISSSYFFA